jgi:hypothetical protein
MKDLNDKSTQNLPEMALEAPRRGRPATGRARTSTQRARDLRASDQTALAEKDSSEWNERQCLAALAKPDWRGTALGEAAWERLGQLMGYPKDRLFVGGVASENG